jgi:hypothetical protein
MAAYIYRIAEGNIPWCPPCHTLLRWMSGCSTPRGRAVNRILMETAKVTRMATQWAALWGPQTGWQKGLPLARHWGRGSVP